jgi:hypothetical protein
VVYALSIILTMGVSLGVWPGVTAFFCSVDNPATSSPCAPRGGHAGIWGRLTGDLFTPLTFVAFGVGDLLGRVASSWGPWGRRPPAAAWLLLYALARGGVAGGILVCNVVTPTPWRLPVLVHSDWGSLGLILLLGLTQVCVCVCVFVAVCVCVCWQPLRWWCGALPCRTVCVAQRLSTLAPCPYTPPTTQAHTHTHTRTPQGHQLSTACMHAPAVVPAGKESEFGPVAGFCITAGCLSGSGGLFFLMKYLQAAS